MTEIQEDTHTEIRRQKAAEKQATRIAAEEKTNTAIAAADLEGLNKALSVCGLKDAVKRSAFIASQGLSSLNDLLCCEPRDGKEMVASHNRNAMPDLLVGYIVGKHIGSMIFWARLQECLYNPPLLETWCKCTLKWATETQEVRSNRKSERVRVPKLRDGIQYFTSTWINSKIQ